MAMLNFKYGAYTQLPKSIAEGTIYVTTDEKAMYVDLNTGSKVERIRLSQIIEISTTTAWEQLQPPYSTEAFYYISDANALLKYIGIDADGKHQWKQINSVKDIQESLNELSDLVDKLSETVGGHSTQLGNHTTDITNLSTSFAKITGYRGTVTDTSTILNPLPGEICIVGTKVYMYGKQNLDATTNSWYEISSIGDRIENLQAAVKAIKIQKNNQQETLPPSI